MKAKNVIKIAIYIVVVTVISYFAMFGLHIGDRTVIKGVKNINTGLDISGGVTIIYQAEPEEGKEITEEDLKKSVAVIEKRLYAKNIYDYIVRSDVSTNQITVEIPVANSDESQDPLKAVEGLDKTAKVEFRDPDSNVLLSGDDIVSARYSEIATDSTGLRSPHVELTFSDEGAQKFSEATGNLIGKAISIYLDDTCLTSPIVKQQITSNNAIITMGNGDYNEKKASAQEYAMLIDSGALPFTLKVISKEYIGPYIGQKALDVSIKAGIVALILIALIMIVVYRLPGVVSTISLIAYTALTILIIANTNISLTLPGIAGLILSLGMAVDANVIIFERFKEELKQNIGYKRAFERSFKNAMTAIIDGNVTTFTVAILLYIVGVGLIKGFGIILALGVVLSLVTAVLFTKYLLKEFIPLYDKCPYLFGSKKEGKKND
ncbi:MAG: protein translocase subunit SecD [Clostridia bacterium]|nr:protein translocase subunit SecD [Clostridia bacterium]